MMVSYPGFEKLSLNAYIHQPSLKDASSSRASASSSPKSIITLCTWMAAGPKLISRYADQYISQFPDSVIILITTSVKEFISLSEVEWSSRLEPVINTILSYPDVPVHGAIYSNGGSNALNQLARTYHHRTGSAFLLKKLIVDSAPGSPNLRASHRAMILSTNPPTYIYPLASLFIWIFLGFYWLYSTIFRAENPIERVRTRLNDSRLFETGGERVYIYSKSDQLVDWQWVESSAKEAEGRGWEIKLEEFKGSKHVAHALKDKERYWLIVSDTLAIV